MTASQNTQSETDFQSAISVILTLLIHGYKKSTSEVAAATFKDEATITRWKRKQRPGDGSNLLICQQAKAKIENEMRDMLASKAKEAGMTVEEFTLCCVGRVGHEVLEEFRDKSKPPVEEGRRGFVFYQRGAGRISTKSDSTGKTLLKNTSKK